MPIHKPSILQLQQEGVLDGQIRIGTSTPGKNGGKAAVRLNTWRFTSPSRRAVEGAAAKFGGEVEPWDSDRGMQWQVITPKPEIEVYFGGGATVDQWMTHWEKGVLLRRCTGAEDAVNSVTGQPCECTATGRELCKPETKLRVRFPDLPGIGWWRFTSHGLHVAGEFHEKAKFLLELAERGIYVPAFLILREMKLPGKRFPVVHIDIPVSVEDIALGRNGVGTLAEIMGAKREALALTAGPSTNVAALPEGTNGPEPTRTSAESARVASAATSPGEQAAEEPAELARKAADWVQRPARTRAEIASFLERTGTSPAMDESVTVTEADSGEVVTTLRELVGDRLAELAPTVREDEERDGGYYDAELGATIPPGVEVDPSEYAQGPA